MNFINSSYDSEKSILDIKKLSNHGFKTDDILKEIKIPSMTLGHLVKKYWAGRKVDLLIIDAEGHESEIIPSIDFNIIKPEAIFFESHNIGIVRDEINGFLVKNGYEVTKLVGDSVALLTHPT